MCNTLMYMRQRDKTYTVNRDTAAKIDQLRDRMESAWHVRPTYGQTLRHAVEIALATTPKEGGEIPESTKNLQGD